LGSGAEVFSPCWPLSGLHCIGFIVSHIPEKGPRLEIGSTDINRVWESLEIENGPVRQRLPPPGI